MKRISLLLAWLLLTSGCVRSLHPYYTEAQLVFDPSLNGTWSDAEKKSTFAVTGDAEHKLYEVLYTDVEKNKIGHFKVHLAMVQAQLIADIAPADPQLEDSDEYKAHLVPVHSFMLVSYDAQAIRLRSMSFEWFKKYIHEHPDSIEHELIEGSDDNIILTAPPDHLQAFILKNLTTEGAYGETAEFRRISATTRP